MVPVTCSWLIAASRAFHDSWPRNGMVSSGINRNIHAPPLQAVGDRDGLWSGFSEALLLLELLQQQLALLGREAVQLGLDVADGSLPVFGRSSSGKTTRSDPRLRRASRRRSSFASVVP